MNDLAATPVSTPKRDREACTGVPRGRLPVADHVGEMAAEAAQALRRAGLRPALERSFGWDPQLYGQVVAQEPPVDSEAARNSLVTLYVAAPGTTPVDEHPAGPPVPSSESSMPRPAAEQDAECDSAIQQTDRQPRQRRKPRPAKQAPRVFDTPPAAIQLDTDPAPMAATLLTDDEPTEEWIPHDETPSIEAQDDEQLEDDADGGEDDEPAGDELVVYADDLFAGRTPVMWRRVYPARRQLTSLDNQHHGRWSR